MKDVSTKLFYLRTIAKWTQEHVANKIGVSKTIYLGIEKNASRITIERLESIISLYGITMEKFFSFSVADVNAFIKGEMPGAIKREFIPQVLASLEVISKLLAQLVQHSLQDQKKQMEDEKNKESQKNQRSNPTFRAII